MTVPADLRIKVKINRGQRTRKECGAFTLVEILVSLVVLSLIVIVIAQIFGTSSTAISQNSKTMNALDASEAVLQQIGLDISRMVLRNDVDYGFAKNLVNSTASPEGNDSISFYARTLGLSSTGTPSTGAPRPLSVVEYQVVQNSTTQLLELDYGAQQIDWNNSGSFPFVTTAATQLLAPTNTLPTVSSFTTLAPEVIRMEICFVLFNDPVQTDSPPRLLTATVPAYISSTNVPYPIQNVAGLLVGIVVIDPKSRLLLPSGVDLKVAKLFPDATVTTANPLQPANQDLLSLWTPLNTTAKLEAQGVPAQAVAGVRVYQKYCPLPW